MANTKPLAEQVVFQQAGVGAVVTNVQSKLRESVSVKDFGAAGDGVTDDTAAIQAAIAANSSVFFPKGVYVVTSQLALPNYTFYDDQPGNVIYGAGAQIVIDGAFTLFTSDRVGDATGYTSKWTFRNLSFLSSTPGSAVFDMDRIYNSVFTQCVFEGLTSAFYSHADRAGDPNYPNGYIQSAIIRDNHFSQCSKGINAKRAFNLTIDANYFEACVDSIAVDGLGDPACNMIRITNNVLEGSTGTPITLGAVYGGVIQGNYFEGNSGASTSEIKLDVTGAAYHRGLVISANQFQPTAAQKADSNFYNIRIANILSNGQGPVIIGNVAAGPRLVYVPDRTQMLVSGNHVASGSALDDTFPLPGQTAVEFGNVYVAFYNNRATAYNGAGTWKVLEILNVTAAAVYDINGFFNLYNAGGNLLGATQVSFKVRTYIDAQGVITAALVGALQLEEITGARDSSGNPLYASYWGAVTPSFSVSGTTVTVSFDTFNDYSIPGPGAVYSLGQQLSVARYDGTTSFGRVKLGVTSA